MIHVDIVIISYAKNDQLLKETTTCLESLFKSEDRNKVKFHAYVVESNKEVTYKSEGDIDITTIHPEVPFGYHRYLNIGRKAGNSDYVVLCNNDLTFGENWASNAIKVLEKRNIWSAGCCNPKKKAHQAYINDGKEYVDGWGVSNQITGWCIFQKREIYEHIGDLDEAFEFWYADNDYSMTLQKHGFYNILIISSIVFHHNTNAGSTLDKETDRATRDRMTSGGRRIFEEKWLK